MEDSRLITDLQEAAEKYPLYLRAERIITGYPRWRVDVFGKGMSHSRFGYGGDAQLVHAEDTSLSSAMAKASMILEDKVKLLDSGKGWGSFGLD